MNAPAMYSRRWVRQEVFADRLRGGDRPSAAVQRWIDTGEQTEGLTPVDRELIHEHRLEDLGSEQADFLRGMRCYNEAPIGTGVALTRPHPQAGFVTIVRVGDRPEGGWGAGEHLVSYANEAECRRVCEYLGWEIRQLPYQPDDPWSEYAILDQVDEVAAP